MVIKEEEKASAQVEEQTISSAETSEKLATVADPLTSGEPPG